MSNPTIGDVNVRGYVIDAPWNTTVPPGGQTFECLESVYGKQSADSYNPLIFSSVEPTGFAYGTECVFDIVAAPWDATKGVAANVRRA